MDDYKYFRIHTNENAYLTKLPRGLFTAIGKLVDNKTMTEIEIEQYWNNRNWFEANLPVPPFYKNNNPDKAITWFKNNKSGKEIFSKMTHYIEMASKYKMKLFLTKTNEIPGNLLYEDEFQIAVSESIHSGTGFVTSEY